MFAFVMDRRSDMLVKRIYKEYPQDYGTKIHEGTALIILKVLQDHGLFTFLESPKTLQEIMNHFGFTDEKYLTLILHAFVEDKFLDMNTTTYSVNTAFLNQIKDPKIYTEKMSALSNNPSLKSAAELYTKTIPERLRGKYRTEFADNKTTVKWDQALAHKMYKDLRDASLKFANILNRQGKLLDLGCGTGVGLLDMWLQFHKKNYFEQDSRRKIQLFGVDPSDDLLEIAKNEWDMGLADILGQDRDMVKKSYGNTFPQFIKGSAHEIPFEDNFFDIVYTSQVLHFDDTELALKEMYRVLKPGGVVVGNEYPDNYMTIGCQTIEGAKGSFTKDQYDQILKDIKAKNIHFYESLPANHFLFFKYSK